MPKINRRTFIGLTLPIYIFLFIFVINNKNAYAGEFIHDHSDYCYGEVPETCSNHRLRSANAAHNYYCQRCQLYQSFKVTTYLDICDNGLRADVDLGSTQTCSVCGYVRYNDRVNQEPHIYNVVRQVCGCEVGEKVANVSIVPASTSWTAGSVALSVNVNVLNDKFALAALPYNYGAGYTADSSIEVNENGLYSVTVLAADGTTATADCKVINIDKTGPLVSLVKSTEAWTENGLTICAYASDELSGIAGYSFDGSNYGGESSMKVTKNGTYSVSVKDNVGNVTTESITISNIGRDPEVVKAEKEAADKAAADKAAADKAAADKAAADKAAADKAAADKLAADKNTNMAVTGTATGTSTVTGTATGINSADKTTNKTGSTLAGLLGIGIKKDKLTDVSANDTTEPSKNLIGGKDAGTDVSGNILTVNGGLAGSLNGLVSVNNGKDTLNESDGLGQDGSEVYDKDLDGMNSDGQIFPEEEFATSKPDGGLGFATFSREERAMWYVRIGSVLLLIGLAWFSTFSYVYMIDKGRIRLVSIVNVKKEKNRLILEISEKKLSKHGRYMIYYSPWLRITKKDKPVYIMLKERENVLNTDNGMSFAY